MATLLKVSQIHRKKNCIEVSFSSNCRPLACNFVKKRLQHKCFLVNFAKILRTSSLQNTSGRLPPKNFVFNSLMLLICYFIHLMFIYNRSIISIQYIKKTTLLFLQATLFFNSALVLLNFLKN